MRKLLVFALILFTVSLFAQLPVSLINFDVRDAAGLHLLQWSTSYEEDVSHFEVQHSLDGYSFEWAGDVEPGYGNYSFEIVPRIGTNYYRLIIWDLDGSYDFSNVISLYSNYDIFDSPHLRDEINVYDLSGRRVNFGQEHLSGLYIVEYRGEIYKILTY